MALSIWMMKQVSGAAMAVFHLTTTTKGLESSNIYIDTSKKNGTMEALTINCHQFKINLKVWYI